MNYSRRNYLLQQTYLWLAGGKGGLDLEKDVSVTEENDLAWKAQH